MGSCPDTDIDPVIFYVLHAVIQQLHGYHNTRKTKVSVPWWTYVLTADVCKVYCKRS